MGKTKQAAKKDRPLEKKDEVELDRNASTKTAESTKAPISNSFTLQHIITGALIALIGYHIVMLQKMSSTISSLEARLSTIEIYTPAARSSSPKEVYDIPSHAPHKSYLKNIPTKDDSKPLEPEKTYTYDDFPAVFNVTPLHTQIMTTEAIEILGDHDPKTDKYYLDFENEIMDRYDEYTAYIEQGSHELEDRERFYVKWASVKSGFGLFAKQDIKAGEIIGVYGGVVSTNVENTDYMWDYLTHKVQGKKVSLGLDARETGNYLRFVNHAGEGANTKPHYITYNNYWNVLYICVKDIKAGDEVTTDYGEAYFETRV